MIKRTNYSNGTPLAVDLKTLQSMLSLGRKSACDVAVKADAVISVGRRKIYNVEKIKNYLNKAEV